MIVTTKNRDGSRSCREIKDALELFDILVHGKLLLPLRVAEKVSDWKISDTSIVFSYVFSNARTGADEARTIQIDGSAEEMVDLGKTAVIQGMHPHGTWTPARIEGHVATWCNRVRETQSLEENIKLGLILFCDYDSHEEIDALMKLSIIEINAAHRLAQSEGWAVMRVVKFCAA